MAVLHKTPTAANRLCLDYREEAARLGRPAVGIIDSHAHINGVEAAVIYREVCDAFGIERTYSQTQLSQAAAVKGVLGDRVRFVAVPSYMDDDRGHAFTDGFLDALQVWRHEHGARLVKFWAAPRSRDYAGELGVDPAELFALDSPWRLRIAAAAKDMGMALMVHVADPDTWFATKYADAGRYGSKLDQYGPLERLLEETGSPCLAAHMGGWPEDLEFLSGLLDRHPSLVLDTSATKWIVRELSRHSHDELVGFLDAYQGRILFGSDIVTHDEHLVATDPDSPAFGNQLACSPGEAFDLYASRYWALRTMFETDYRGESAIADPDLAMVEPGAYDAMSAPQIVGRSLGADRLGWLYRKAAEQTIDRWYAGELDS